MPSFDKLSDLGINRADTQETHIGMTSELGSIHSDGDGLCCAGC